MGCLQHNCAFHRPTEEACKCQARPISGDLAGHGVEVGDDIAALDGLDGDAVQRFPGLCQVSFQLDAGFLTQLALAGLEVEGN